MNREIKFRGRRIRDLTGFRNGNVLVEKFVDVTENGDARWQYLCLGCGENIIGYASNIIRSKGVGCDNCRKEALRKKHYIHGEADTRLHVIWQHMIVRCEKANSPDYANYGGRGIRVYDGWKDYVTFRGWALANGYKDNLTIDRIDNGGNYHPDNCRWVTRKTQNNNRRTNRRYVLNGKERTLSEWCDIYKVEYGLVKGRIKRGVDIETALTAKRQKPWGFTKNDNPELLEVLGDE